MDCDILIIGQGGKTGFARVLKTIAVYLSRKFKIVYFAYNLYTQVKSELYVIETNKELGDIFGAKQVPVLIEKYKPNVIFMCHDYWLYDVHYNNFKRLGYANKVVLYCPVDENSPYVDRAYKLKNLSHIIFYTHYGMQLFLQEWNLAGYNHKNVVMPQIEIIPHGVDSTKFYPIVGGKKRARQILFPDKKDMYDSFIILNGNRNTPRKRLDLTLMSFSLFVRNKPKHIYLYLQIDDNDCGVDLISYIKKLGIEDRIILSKFETHNDEINDEQLNIIYNACDIGINTSSGEGWGLVSLEHAATGAAQIVPNHTACKEIWYQSGLLIDLDRSSTENIIDTKHLAKLLSNVYNDREYLKTLSDKSLHLAQEVELSWDRICERWINLFEKFIVK